jgi:hypothetical protein
MARVSSMPGSQSMMHGLDIVIAGIVEEDRLWKDKCVQKTKEKE